MKTIDINSDLGEGFGSYVMADDATILSLITSANVACGFHAGDFMTMHETATLAKQNRVCIGAHVGYPDRQGFGRRHIAYTSKELELMTIYQLGALRAIAESTGMRLTHANFHGALGNLSFVDEGVATAVLRALKTFDPDLKFVALPNTAAYKVAQRLNLDIVASFLADRAYTPEGLLVGRKTPGSLIKDPAQIRARVQRAVVEGKVRAIDGTDLDMPVDSILLHSDTPGAIDIAKTIRQAVKDVGGQIAPFA
ncbi:LamB/YcsF family protein [Bordetella sp. 15P40C-2]|uniref:LamB/YcsF family protein n=1 Tax=Bordetella sp. 15P40C-2 TaxID=2572246 RepID=UPI0013214AF4|nr:5-oxoprolinase subunit PxpA [Bordetella sp. 15P40C-2]MVW72336.1 5-oxoprolinase subunit PxpA [Bordetella sp. 15P40C-2]